MDHWVRYVITGTLGVVDGTRSLAATLPGWDGESLGRPSDWFARCRE
jgi:hypothetical protein